MKKEYVSALVASALGAVVGLLGLYHYGQWKFLGLPVGALVGYLLYNPQQVLDGLKYAAQQTFDSVGKLHMPSKDFWEVMGWNVLTTGGALATFFTPYVLTGTVDDVLTRDSGFIIAVGVLTLLLQGIVWMTYSWEGVDKGLNLAYNCFRWVNPLGMSIALPVLAGFVLWGVACKVQGLMMKFFRFVRIWFVFIHSQGRLLCAIDSTLGALAGFAVGYEGLGVVVAALVGGFCGVCHAWAARWIVSAFASASA